MYSNFFFKCWKIVGDFGTYSHNYFSFLCEKNETKYDFLVFVVQKKSIMFHFQPHTYKGIEIVI